MTTISFLQDVHVFTPSIEAKSFIPHPAFIAPNGLVKMTFRLVDVGAKNKTAKLVEDIAREYSVEL